jgi:hypothetical protein
MSDTAELSDALPQLTITVGRESLLAALNCLNACGTDEREPERYRLWYREAEREIRQAMESV